MTSFGAREPVRRSLAGWRCMDGLRLFVLPFMAFLSATAVYSLFGTSLTGRICVLKMFPHKKFFCL